MNNKLPKEKLSLLAQVKFLIKFFQVRSFKESGAENVFMMKKISFGVVFVLVAFFALSAYAYASPTVTAHDGLFTLKQMGENLKVSVSSGKDKVEAYVQIAERRMAELEYLTLDEADIAFKFINTVYADDEETLTDEEEEIVDTAGLMEEATEDAMNAIEEIDNEDEAEEAVSTVEELQDEEEKVLEEVLETKKEWKERFKERIAVMKENIMGNKEAMKEARENIKKFRAEHKGEFRLRIKTLTEEEKELKTEALEEKIAAMKEEAEAWKEKLTEEVEDTEKLEELFARIDGRIEKIEVALEEGKLLQAWGLLKTVHAFKNNAKHFVKHKEIREDVKEAVAEFVANKKEILEDFKQRKEEVMREYKEKFKEEFGEVKKTDWVEMNKEERVEIREMMIEKKKEMTEKMKEIRDDWQEEGKVLKEKWQEIKASSTPFRKEEIKDKKVKDESDLEEETEDDEEETES